MNSRQLLKSVAVVLLLCSALFLYADLQSIHQIYRIKDAMIERAPDAQTREALRADRDERNRSERIEKIEVGGVLVVNVVLVLFVAASFLRRSGHPPECP